MRIFQDVLYNFLNLIFVCIMNLIELEQKIAHAKSQGLIDEESKIVFEGSGINEVVSFMFVDSEGNIILS